MSDCRQEASGLSPSRLEDTVMEMTRGTNLGLV